MIPTETSEQDLDGGKKIKAYPNAFICQSYFFPFQYITNYVYYMYLIFNSFLNKNVNFEIYL